MDVEDLLPGQQWDAQIQLALQSSDVVIACLSQSTLRNRGYLRRELRAAISRAERMSEDTVFLIPARLEACRIPQKLHFLQYVDLFADGGFERLASALRYRADEIRRVSITGPAMSYTPAELEVVSGGTIAVVTPRTLNVRQSPGTASSVVGTLRRGTRVRIAGREGNWIRIATPRVYGYAHGLYLRLVSDPESMTLNIESG
jgi:hypothetical protein